MGDVIKSSPRSASPSGAPNGPLALHRPLLIIVTAPRSPIGPRTPFLNPPPTSPREGPPRVPSTPSISAPLPLTPLAASLGPITPPSLAGPILVRRHLRPMRGGSHPSYKSAHLPHRPGHGRGGGVRRRLSFIICYAWMGGVKGGGCCIARYNAGNGFTGGGGGGGGGRRSSQVDQIMLRFRPIAPKPSPPCPPDYAPPPAPGRKKRRCGPGGRSRCGSRSRRKQAPAAESAPVTLPLLPEAPEPKSSPERDSSPSSTLGAGVEAEWVAPAVSASAEQAARAAWACVTVERVGEASGEGAWEEMRRGLELEEAGPGFVTDAWNCVRWVNDAFRKMVGGAGKENGAGGGGVMVALVAKEELPGSEVKAFTCRVRVQYTSGEKERHPLTAPCDVWRMEGGGCTWRLDVKAALSLGR